MLHRCYGLAPAARLAEIGGAKLLLSHHPLRRFVVNEAAWLLLGALDGETPLHELVDAPTPELVGFLEHKVDAGLLHAEYRVTPPAEWPAVEVIVPVYGNLAGLRRCLDALAGLRYPREKISVTVVDDATPFSLLDRLRGVDFAGLTTSWRHLKANMGPATARNAGAGLFHGALTERMAAAREQAPVLAFVDSDCAPAPDWLEPLVGILEEPSLAAVGGRVDGLARRGLLARYEAACASLYMGERAGQAGLPGGRIPYVPACNLLVKRPVFESLSGFREGMRLGEDVDFCWRLTAAGHGLFYYPGGTVFHGYRTRWGPFLNRKRAYAFSESWLRRRHPAHYPRRSRLPFVASVFIAGAALAGAYWPGLAAAALPLLLGRAAAVWRNRGALRGVAPWRAAAAGLRGTVAEWLQHARWFCRHGLILWLPLLAVFPRLLPLGGLVLAMGLGGEWLARRPAAPPWAFAAGFCGECLGYSLGRLQGEAHAWWRRLTGRA